MTRTTDLPFNYLLVLAQATTDGVTEEISDSADSLIDQVSESIPRIGIALTIIVVGYLASRLLRVAVRRVLAHRNGPSFSQVMSRLTSWIFLAFVTGAAIAITFPSVKPVDLLAGLGFFSVAVGFAFQDILENTLSGVLLLFREPFVSGDQILVDGNEGTVEGITIRETQIRQFDGRLLIVPNRDVYKNAIRVQTNRADRRVEFTVGVSYDADLGLARRTMVDALKNLASVRAAPQPQALLTTFNTSTMDFAVRFWVDSSQGDAVQATDEAIQAVKEALDREEIAMPADIVELSGLESLRSFLSDSE